MARKVLVLLCFCVSSLVCFSQGDYLILGDSLQIYGDIRNYGKGKILQDDGLWHTTAGELEGNVYSFDWVTEYRRGNDIYKSITLDGDRQMYHELVAGKYSLYKKNNRYVLKVDNQFTAINRKNFRSVLVKSLACTGKEESIYNVAYSKLSMQRIVAGSNDGSCNFDDASPQRFGIIGGYTFVNQRIRYGQIRYANVGSNAYSLGLFYDVPMPTSHPWLNWYVESYAIFPYSATIEYVEPDPFQTRYFTLTYQSYVLSSGFKVLAPRGPIKPYFIFAPSVLLTKIDSPNGVRVRGTEEKVIEIGPQSYMQAGFNSVVGIQVPVKKRKNINVELRYSGSHINQRAVYEMSTKSTSLWIGFSF